jgi:Flp pilus assembly protein TadD
MQITRVLVVAGLSLGLAACKTTDDTASEFNSKPSGVSAYAAMPSSHEVTGSAGRQAKSETSKSEMKREMNSAMKPETTASLATLLPGSDGVDDVTKGREQFRSGNYAGAEVSFQRATRMNPRDAEGWLGLAACYDRMRRFELADRAYVQAMAIKGPTSEILNNQGYSYYLRGDLKRARNTLTAAKNKDPGNRFVQNNLQLVERRERTASAAPTPKAH